MHPAHSLCRGRRADPYSRGAARGRGGCTACPSRANVASHTHFVVLFGGSAVLGRDYQVSGLEVDAQARHVLSFAPGARVHTLSFGAPADASLEGEETIEMCFVPLAGVQLRQLAVCDSGIAHRHVLVLHDEPRSEAEPSDTQEPQDPEPGDTPEPQEPQDPGQATPQEPQEPQDPSRATHKSPQEPQDPDAGGHTRAQEPQDPEPGDTQEPQEPQDRTRRHTEPQEPDPEQATHKHRTSQT